LDTWHNSGASFYARFTEEEYRKYVPVDFLTEAIDQTRGWANRLLQEHVIFTGKTEPPYKAFLFQGLTQDAKGRKMSKSLGNVIEANQTLDKYSADVCRFYLLRKCSPIDANDFDPQELGRRTYQILSTLYHLNRFFAQNAEFDNFNAKKHTLAWAEKEKKLTSPDLWLLSKLQETIEAYTEKLETCEFNQALAMLEDFVIENMSRLYVPMVRKELWTDDPSTLDRRLAVYATLWHVLRSITLLFNPVTPHLSEALHQNVFRKFDDRLPESVNFEQWPQPDSKLRNKRVEEDFQTLFKCISLVYSARQDSKVKRRWPLRRMTVIASQDVVDTLKRVEPLLLELANVKSTEYAQEAPEHVTGKGWVSAAEDNVQVFLDTRRDEGLLGEGLMRDLARRVQALRKELGYMPTDVLKEVDIAELDDEGIRLLQPYVKEMEQLVRTKKINLRHNRDESNLEWHESQLDDKKIYISIPTQHTA
jgi:isoleucyl-tRNA synthetase